ncbi:TPA: glycosyltransferase, partial [Klebsiella pneumoniae]|nr:glycosyltransferase family 4 protein [Klebsiella pneumoniae]HDS2660511.1 glycosyltransferase [Klebsiella pneumoniae]HDS9449973.1 glycosyltransferase [Klebsiella pneumoniae subsp. pneumoniae]HEE1347813.1 glycosyltransferase [Klebsiella pneumoniae]
PSHIPVMHPFKYDKFDLHNCNVLFVGNLFMPNNLQGLIWYLNKVHPMVIKENPDIKLTIAGNAKNGISEELKKAISIYDGNAINLITSPSDEELQAIYDGNCIFINPMLNGAGVKLKNLDAMRNTMFVVSTSIGSEGTGTNHGEQLVIANDEVLFAKHIINYSKNISGMKEIAFNAFSFIQENYDSKKVFSSIFKEN